MKHHTIGARVLAALLPLAGAVALALPASADLPSALMNAALLTEKTTYHVDMTETAGTQTIKATGDIQSFAPMKMRMTTDMGAQGTMQMVIVSPDIYMKLGNQPWKKTAGDASTFDQYNAAAEMAKNKGDYTVVDIGMQLKDGQMLHGYRTTNTAKKFTSTIFLDGSGRFARLEAPNMVMRFTNFGENVNIAPPM